MLFKMQQALNHQSFQQAGMLYEEAAEMGHVSAMFNTAVYYENGLGGKFPRFLLSYLLSRAMVLS